MTAPTQDAGTHTNVSIETLGLEQNVAASMGRNHQPIGVIPIHQGNSTVCGPHHNRPIPRGGRQVGEAQVRE